MVELIVYCAVINGGIVGAVNTIVKYNLKSEAERFMYAV